MINRDCNQFRLVLIKLIASSGLKLWSLFDKLFFQHFHKTYFSLFRRTEYDFKKKNKFKSSFGQSLLSDPESRVQTEQPITKDQGGYFHSNDHCQSGFSNIIACIFKANNENHFGEKKKKKLLSLKTIHTVTKKTFHWSALK